MSLLFWTDPHLGLNRTSHTTPVSRVKLRDALYTQANNILNRSHIEGHSAICLGDLFDTTDNEEAVIAQGASIAGRCALVLSGNHDLANRDGKMSSLELIGHLSPDSSVALADSTSDYFVVEFPEANVIVVPHKRTQTLFDLTLQEIGLHVRRIPTKVNILVLHCNYESPFATDDSSLNLTRDIAGLLLGDDHDTKQTVDYILIGHEHIPRADFGGKLQILGNTHPTSFSDISDKFIWEFDGTKLSPVKIWSKDSHLVKDWEWLLNETSTAPTTLDMELVFAGMQFIEINGTAPARKLPEIAKAVQKLWSQAPDALMIRNNVKSEAVQVEAKEMNRALDIPSRITEELQGSPFANTWANYLSRI
ncbi:metallophosphoesterase [Methylovulum miyakonense]|uniref:metallophosphoesterase n=1 Tax=Methylovulum miyakonense TaxID=645578 RepID=UPI000367D44A|nr:metallophosphoesterase [Methylovulum miyakonense]